MAAATAVDPPASRGPGLGPRPLPADSRALSPLWTAYDGPRALARIQEAMRKELFEDEEHPAPQEHPTPTLWCKT